MIVWGGKTGLESHRHIHRAFHQNALKLGYESHWFNDEPGNKLLADDVVIAADIWSKYLYHRRGVDYVLHNFDASHPVIRQTEPERILRLQVWTTDAFGDEWAPYRQYSPGHRILFQPWGADLLAEEFMEPVYNHSTNAVVFVGAVWSDTLIGTELGNKQAIAELDQACQDRGLELHLHTQIPETQMIALSRSARLAPTVVGNWQTEHGYLPCRAFKHASYGIPVLSNSSTVNDLFAIETPESIDDLIASSLRLRQGPYLELVRAHQRLAANYTYRESIQAILRALEEGRGSQGIPFLDWRTHARDDSAELQLEHLRGLLIDARAVIGEAVEPLERADDLIDVLTTTRDALAGREPAGEMLARANAMLDSLTVNPLVVAQKLRDEEARINSAL